MKKILLLFALLVIGNFSFAHDYFFAFADVDYNSTNKTLEISIEMSGHDIENALSKAGYQFKKHIENETQNTEFKKFFEEYLLKHFVIFNNNKIATLKSIGYEVLPNDLLYVYFVSEEVDISSEFSFQFDLLMNEFPAQQNKLTFNRNNVKHSLVFLPTNSLLKQSIKP